MTVTFCLFTSIVCSACSCRPIGQTESPTTSSCLCMGLPPAPDGLFKSYTYCCYWCMCVCVCPCPDACVKVREQTAEVKFLFIYLVGAPSLLSQFTGLPQNLACDRVIMTAQPHRSSGRGGALSCLPMRMRITYFKASVQGCWQKASIQNLQPPYHSSALSVFLAHTGSV